MSTQGVYKNVSRQFRNAKTSTHPRASGTCVCWVRQSLCGKFEIETAPISPYWRKAISVYFRGLRKTLFIRLQPSHPRPNPYGWSALCLSIRWMQQKICTVHKPQVSHSNACQAKVGEVLSMTRYCIIIEQFWLVHNSLFVNSKKIVKNGSCRKRI